MQTGHFNRNTLREGVLDVGWNVGDVLGVESTMGAGTMVSLGADGGGSTASVTLVAGEVMTGASSFILALDLVGGMYA